MKLPLRYYGDPILRQKAVDVTSFDADLEVLVSEMIKVMDHHNGCGLAAPQVGILSRVFVLRELDDPEPDPDRVQQLEPRVFVNPRLSQPSREKEQSTEGCLSIPGIRADVDRPLQVQVEFFDLRGKLQVEEFRGFIARIIMHENDHLNGRLFVDRVQGRQKKGVEAKLRTLRRQHRSVGG